MLQDYQRHGEERKDTEDPDWFGDRDHQWGFTDMEVGDIWFEFLKGGSYRNADLC